MKYYATVAASSSVVKSQDTVERIERRVLDSNPIMEAFGEKTGDRWCLVKVNTITVDVPRVNTLSAVCRQCLHATEQQQQSLWEVHPAPAGQVGTRN